MGRYIWIMTVIAALYVLNRVCLLPVMYGWPRDILSWYGADVLAGALILCVVNALLALAHRPPLRRFWPVTLFLLGCGLFWEVITPLYLPRSVGDIWDMFAYWFGGIVVWLIETKRASSR